MGICGYHLRCLNHKQKCSECRYQKKDRDKDYLHDSLSIWPKGKEAVYVSELASFIKPHVMTLDEVF